jgi:pimeloyl-ACP methyl ester carboxylesterase
VKTRVSERVFAAPDDLRLFARVFGEARANRVPVVCIPGLTRNSRDFEVIAPALADERLAVAVDLRGRGQSSYDATGASYWVDVYASDVLTVMDELEVARACLFGESLGGIVSLRIHALAADRVAGVILSDIGPDLAPEGVARIFSYAGKLPPVTSWPAAVDQAKFVSEAAAPGLSEDEWLAITHRRYRAHNDGTIAPDHDPGIVTATVPVQTAEDRWRDFDALDDTPTLVIRGALSDVLASATVTQMQQRHPGLAVLEVPDRGHCPLPHEPACLAAIAGFVCALDAD